MLARVVSSICTFENRPVSSRSGRNLNGPHYKKARVLGIFEVHIHTHVGGKSYHYPSDRSCHSAIEYQPFFYPSKP